MDCCLLHPPSYRGYFLVEDVVASYREPVCLDYIFILGVTLVSTITMAAFILIRFWETSQES